MKRSWDSRNFLRLSCEGWHLSLFFLRHQEGTSFVDQNRDRWRSWGGYVISLNKRFLSWGLLGTLPFYQKCGLFSLMNFCSLEQLFGRLFLSASRARKHGCPNGDRAHLPKATAEGAVNVWTPVQKSVLDGSPRPTWGQETRGGGGERNKKVDLGQHSSNQDLRVGGQDFRGELQSSPNSHPSLEPHMSQSTQSNGSWGRQLAELPREDAESGLSTWLESLTN